MGWLATNFDATVGAVDVRAGTGAKLASIFKWCRQKLAGVLRDSVLLRCAQSCSPVDKQRASRGRSLLKTST